MVMLLAVYQKMRYIRKYNEATLKVTKFTSLYDRITKNIERVQKMYTDRKAKLEARATKMKNSASIWLRNNMGLGTSDFNTSIYSYNGLNGYKMGAITEYMQKGQVYNGTTTTDGNGNKVQGTYAAIDDPSIFITAYQNSGGTFKDSEGNWMTKGGTSETFTEEDYKMFNQAKSQADIAYSNAQNQYTTMNQGFQEDVDNWLEAATEEMEAEQDEALSQLSYKQTMYELSKTQAEQEQATAKENKDKYTELAKDAVRDHAPHFGLA